MKKLQRYKDWCREIWLLNSKIIGHHNYYQIATHGNLDFGVIAFIVSRTIAHRLNPKRTGTATGYVKERYGSSKQLRFVGSTPIVPIGYVQHKNPMDKKKLINNYTADGRAYIHKELENIDMSVLYSNSTLYLHFKSYKTSQIKAFIRYLRININWNSYIISWKMCPKAKMWNFIQIKLHCTVGKTALTDTERTLFTAAHSYLKGVMNGHTSMPVNAWKAEYAKLTAEQKILNQRYLALKDEVKEAEQIRKSVYSILRQEQREQPPRKTQDMDR